MPTTRRLVENIQCYQMIISKMCETSWELRLQFSENRKNSQIRIYFSFLSLLWQPKCNDKPASWVSKKPKCQKIRSSTGPKGIFWKTLSKCPRNSNILKKCQKKPILMHLHFRTFLISKENDRLLKTRYLEFWGATIPLFTENSEEEILTLFLKQSVQILKIV